MCDVDRWECGAAYHAGHTRVHLPGPLGRDVHVEYRAVADGHKIRVKDPRRVAVTHQRATGLVASASPRVPEPKSGDAVGVAIGAFLLTTVGVEHNGRGWLRRTPAPGDAPACQRLDSGMEPTIVMPCISVGWK